MVVSLMLPSVPPLLGAVVLVPEGMGVSGLGITVGRVEEVSGVTPVGLVLSSRPQPAKSAASITKISAMLQSFFICVPPVSEYTASISLKAPFTPGKIRQNFFIAIFSIAFFSYMRYNRKS
jgi:hypothetical protein